MRIPVIPATTAGSTQTFDAQTYSRVTFVANGLGAGETCAINVGTSSGFTPSRTSAGTAHVLAGTGNITMLTLEGGFIYQLVLSATAGSTTVDAVVSDSILTS